MILPTWSLLDRVVRYRMTSEVGQPEAGATG